MCVCVCVCLCLMCVCVCERERAREREREREEKTKHDSSVINTFAHRHTHINCLSLKEQACTQTLMKDKSINTCPQTFINAVSIRAHAHSDVLINYN